MWDDTCTGQRTPALVYDCNNTSVVWKLDYILKGREDEGG